MSGKSAAIAEPEPPFSPILQSAYHGSQKCVSAEVKLRILKERMAGRSDTKLIQELKRKEQDLLSLASIEVALPGIQYMALTTAQGPELLADRDVALSYLRCLLIQKASEGSA